MEKTPARGAAQVRGYIEQHRAELDSMLATEGQAGKALAERHSKIMDGLLDRALPDRLRGRPG